MCARVQFVKHVTSVTAGELFWPRSHIDRDFWFTILLVLDVGDGPECGGDWAVADCGTGLKLVGGDVLVYNPSSLHGTTEFQLATSQSSRRMLAFFCSKNVLAGLERGRRVAQRVVTSEVKKA